MGAYIIRRVLLMIPTLFGIMVINFLIIQAAPGGPVEQMIQKIKGTGVSATDRISGGGSGEMLSSRQETTQGATQSSSRIYRGAQGLDPEVIKRIEKLYGFDKPLPERFVMTHCISTLELALYSGMDWALHVWTCHVRYRPGRNPHSLLTPTWLCMAGILHLC